MPEDGQDCVQGKYCVNWSQVEKCYYEWQTTKTQLLMCNKDIRIRTTERHLDCDSRTLSLDVRKHDESALISLISPFKVLCPVLNMYFTCITEIGTYTTYLALICLLTIPS